MHCYLIKEGKLKVFFPIIIITFIITLFILFFCNNFFSHLNNIFIKGLLFIYFYNNKTKTIKMV